MKRLTLLTAAGLLASAPLFAMDGGGVSISGEANFGVKFAESDDDSKSELQFHHEFDVKFSASGTTDGGIGFGGSMSIDNTESVSGRTAVAAKTGYIVTEEDARAAENSDKRKALNARFGFDTSNLKEGDVIVSGSTANLSGYEKATDVKGHDRVITAAMAEQVQTYYGVNNTITNVVVFGTTSAELANAEETASDVFLVREAGENGATVWRTTTADVDGADDNDNTPADNEILIATARVILADETGVLDTDSDTAGNQPGKGDGLIFVTSIEEDQEENTGLINRPFRAGTPAVLISVEEKVKLSQAYIDSLSGSIKEADSQSVNNHGEVYISMDMHKLTIGSDLDSADKLAGGLADPGFDGIGIDDVAEGPYGGSAADVRYDGDFGVAKVAISYGDNAGDAAWAAGFSFNVEPVNFGAGFDSNGVMSVGMGFTQGAIAMNALYSTDSDHDEADNEAFKCSDVADSGKASYSAKHASACTAAGWTSASTSGFTGLGNKPDLKNQAFGVDVSYQMSEATSVVLVAAQHKKESAHISYTASSPAPEAPPGNLNLKDTPASYSWSATSTTVDAFGVGFSHDLGGGATLKAGAGSVDSNAVADLGITMKF